MAPAKRVMMALRDERRAEPVPEAPADLDVTLLDEQPAAPSAGAPRGMRTAARLPSFLGSIKVRLAVLYSVLVFGLAALMVGSLYAGVSRALDDQSMTSKVHFETSEGYLVVERTADGFVLHYVAEGTGFTEERVNPVDLIAAQVNRSALEHFKRYSIYALGTLFFLSLGIGYLLADRALRPIGRITRVAKEITATDLSRRIEMAGPKDELRELADTFDDMLTRLDAAWESQRAFIHEASHELRNPIAVIRTNVDVALADENIPPDELRETVAVVGRAAERMGVLVDDLLTHAREERASDRRTTVDGARLVHEAAGEFAASAERRGIRLEPVADPGLLLRGDPVALRQALANLLANAVRLAPEGTTIRVAAGRDGPWIWLAVEDEGPGIAADDQRKVFERFYRGDPARARSEGRSGLGLTIVRQIARAHGGEVGLVSEPSQGSVFSIWLPALVPDDGEVTPERAVQGSVA
ncbi:MAG: HAMP domain-containing sensor histidine kinase [Actinomycetota bacterium]|nr:HAMP domain-containing sensor histidine kinase [Actinomycetota bacterium]